jgi:hypothetical protein
MKSDAASKAPAPFFCSQGTMKGSSVRSEIGGVVCCVCVRTCIGVCDRDLTLYIRTHAPSGIAGPL